MSAFVIVIFLLRSSPESRITIAVINLVKDAISSRNSDIDLESILDIDNARKKMRDVIEVILRKPTEVGGKPDLIVKIYGTEFNIEAKMSNAQYSSVTFAIGKDGKFLIKKDYTFGDKIFNIF